MQLSAWLCCLMFLTHNLFLFQSTLKDYESIPVADYGMAMLRGMGWEPGKGIGKKGRYIQILFKHFCLGFYLIHEASTPFHGTEKNFSFTGECHVYVLRISWPVFVEGNHLCYINETK